METALIIPIYKQYQYWIRMMSGIEKQTHLPENVYVMLDRPTDEEYNNIKDLCNSAGLRNSYKVINMNETPEFVGRPNNLPDFDLFLTGYNRNTAINMAIEDGCEIFVMIDGDCIPEKDLIKSHHDVNSINVPSITCGRRKEMSYNWVDQRERDPKLNGLHLFNKGDGFLIQNKRLLELSTIVWTCNVGMNLKAVKLVKKLNRRFYGRDEVFCSEFLGTWGGEDSFLGIQADMCNIFISMLNGKNAGVRHMHHIRPSDKYNEKSFMFHLKNHIALLNEMQLNNPLTMEFFRD